MLAWITLCLGTLGILLLVRDLSRTPEGVVRDSWIGSNRVDEIDVVVHGGGPHARDRSLGGSSTCHDTADGIGWVLLRIAGVLFCFLGLAIVCDEFFQTSLEVISEVLKLTPDVAGATFLAAGSSAPELFTSLVDAFGDSNSTGTGTIVGSAMFNILVIVALSAAVAGTNGATIEIDWRPVCRDVTFYSYSILLLTIVFLDSEVMWWEGLIMVISYAIYIVFMKYNSQILARCQPQKIGVTEDNIDPSKAADTAKAGTVSKGSPDAGGEKIASSAAARSGTDDEKSATLGVRHRVERKKSGGSLCLGDAAAAAAGGSGDSKGAETKALAAGSGKQAEGDVEAGASGSGRGAGDGDTSGDDEDEDESRFSWPRKPLDQVRCCGRRSVETIESNGNRTELLAHSCTFKCRVLLLQLFESPPGLE